MARLIIMTGTLAVLMGLMLFGLGMGERIHAGANLDDDPRLFVETPAPDGHDPSDDPSVARTKYVLVNFGLLSQDTADLILLNLFDDTSYLAQRHHVAGRKAGNFIWQGSIQDVENSRVTLVIRNDQVMVGNIVLPNGIYQVRYIGDEVHAIYQIDERALPPHRDPIPVGSPNEEEANSTSFTTAETYDDGSIIDVMVVYTPAARVAEGGTVAMEAMIDLAVEETNTAFANSLIYPRLRLVHAAEVNYVEFGAMGTDLSRLRSTTDGFMDEVHSLRNTYAADQVTLIEVSPDYCGYAYVMTNVSSGFESAAFAVVHRTCVTGNFTFGHELGHNVGSHHDRDNASYSAAYPYSFGYQAVGSFRTIMAYSNGCGYCPKFQGFSNPDVMFNGQPTGIDHDTDPANSADNARSINNTAYTVANFRVSGEAPTDPPAAPSDLTATAVSDTQIDLGWTDNANNESGFEVERSPDGTSWQLIGTVGTDATSYYANGLESSALYYFRVRSYNGLGGSAYSNTATATTEDPPPYVEEVAYTEIRIAGTVTGSYPDTWSNDGGREVITERTSGGKPSKRYSYLRHKWVFDVRGGNVVTFSIDAHRSPSPDGDDFRFAYSTDDLAYTDMLTVNKDADDNNPQYYVLPSTTKGLVYIKVSDTDQTQGNQILDSLYVDHMFISSETYPGDPPAAPSNLSEMAVAPTAVDLAWVDNSFDESGFEIERSLDGGSTWSVLGMTDADMTAYKDTGVAPSTSYVYRTRAYNGSGSSAYSNTVQVETPGGIALAATGYKVKGVHHVDLDWSGAGSTNVDIFRGESMLVLTSSDSDNDGSHTDNIGKKGGGSYNYYVCEQDSTTKCSNTVTVTF